ncbi:MAG: DUF2065 domain-containing protein [Alphaproteobacteria bacterium]
MTDLLTAFALVLVIEGVTWALMPEVMRRTVMRMATLPGDRLRFAGLALAAAGVGLVWLVRG